MMEVMTSHDVMAGYYYYCSALPMNGIGLLCFASIVLLVVRLDGGIIDFSGMFQT